MIKIFKFLNGKEWFYAFCTLCLVILQVWFELRIPEYMEEITELVQSPNTPLEAVLQAGVAMLLATFASLLTTFVVCFFVAQIAAGLSFKLRKNVYQKTLGFSMEEMKTFSTSSLITRSTNDITQIQNIVAIGLQVMLKAPILSLWALQKISTKNVEFTYATGVALGALLALISVLIFLAIPKTKKLQTLTDNLNRVTRENLTGLRVVHAYGAQDYQEEKFQQANQNFTQANLFVQRTLAIMFPGLTAISSGLTLSIYVIAAFLISSANQMDKLGLFSDMVVFSSYAMQIIMSFIMITMVFVMLPRAQVSAKRVLEVLNTQTKIQEGTQTSTAKGGSIQFKNVTFSYPDASEAVLSDISFTVNPGETVAIIGSTGSGKSTLVQLMLRFYDCTSGEILLDGLNLKSYENQALRAKIGYVSQKAILFSGTIASNVAYNHPFQQEKFQRAISIAQATDFVKEVGEEGPVSQGGSNLSGGQRQRVSIARAVYQDPELFLFDDSFSALDYKTDRLVREQLNQHTQGTTKFIVAQRIGTILHADNILVLDEGRLVSQGTHQQLMETCQIYQEMALSQLSKEEL